MINNLHVAFMMHRLQCILTFPPIAQPPMRVENLHGRILSEMASHSILTPTEGSPVKSMPSQRYRRIW